LIARSHRQTERGHSPFFIHVYSLFFLFFSLFLRICLPIVQRCLLPCLPARPLARHERRRVSPFTSTTSPCIQKSLYFAAPRSLASARRRHCHPGDSEPVIAISQLALSHHLRIRWPANLILSVSHRTLAFLSAFCFLSEHVLFLPAWLRLRWRWRDVAHALMIIPSSLSGSLSASVSALCYAVVCSFFTYSRYHPELFFRPGGLYYRLCYGVHWHAWTQCRAAAGSGKWKWEIFTTLIFCIAREILCRFSFLLSCLSCLVLTCPALSCLDLSCPALPCLALPCLALLHPISVKVYKVSVHASVRVHLSRQPNHYPFLSSSAWQYFIGLRRARFFLAQCVHRRV